MAVCKFREYNLSTLFIIEEITERKQRKNVLKSSERATKYDK